MGHDETTSNATTDLRQFESVSASPKMAGHTQYVSSESDDFLWPYTVVYFLANGDVVTRKEMTSGPVGASSILHAQSFMVLRVERKSEIDGVPQVEVLKFRGDPKTFFTQIAEAYLMAPGQSGSVEELLKPPAQEAE